MAYRWLFAVDILLAFKLCLQNLQVDDWCAKPPRHVFFCNLMPQMDMPSWTIGAWLQSWGLKWYAKHRGWPSFAHPPVAHYRQGVLIFTVSHNFHIFDTIPHIFDTKPQFHIIFLQFSENILILPHIPPPPVVGILSDTILKICDFHDASWVLCTFLGSWVKEKGPKIWGFSATHYAHFLARNCKIRNFKQQ